MIDSIVATTDEGRKMDELPVADTIADGDDPVASLPTVRDRIVILGRRAAGKTVYLSTLYEKHWKSLDGLSMRALSGNVHAECIRVVEGLRQGRWPPATLAARHWDLELTHEGRRRLLVALDYAGELFRRAFVEDDTESHETAELVKHIDSAAAVIILADPSVASGSDVEAKIDDDYGVVQAIHRIRNWPGGDEVPVVLVLTKADEYGPMIKAQGGLERFVSERFPALARLLIRTPIFQVSAVQTVRDDNGPPRPLPNSIPRGIEKPLLYCLNTFREKERRIEEAMAEDERLRGIRARRLAIEAEERKSTRLVIAIVISMIVLAGCITAIYLALRA